jgi:hypothetical protein
MARGFGAGANQNVKADNGKSQEPSKKNAGGTKTSKK